MNIGFKVSNPGKDVTVAALADLAVTTQLPTLKCDLRAKPKHYGTINFTIASLAPAAKVTLYQIAHGYNYIPSYLTAWSFPAGTSVPSDLTGNATFGIGDIDAALNNGIYIAMYTDNTNFTVTAANFGGSPVTNITGTIRFYIFADDFPLAIG